MSNIFRTEGLQTSNLVHRPASATSAVTFKVKGQGRKVTWCAWQVLADKSRTKRPRKTNIGRKIVHPTSNKAPQFQGQRSKVKVTRTTNAETVSEWYLPNGKAYELYYWYTNAVRRPASATRAVTFKVKGQGCKVTWRVWQVLAGKSRTKHTRNTKIGRKVVHLTGNNVHQFHGQRSKVKSPGNKIIAHTVYTQCLRTGEAYKLQTWYIDGARRPVSTSSAVTSKVKGQGRKVTRSRDASDRCWPRSRERNVLETPKLVGRLPPRATMPTRSKVKVTWSITLHNNTSFRTTIAFYSHSLGGDV